jgi:signal transduction histidine kinase
LKSRLCDEADKVADREVGTLSGDWLEIAVQDNGVGLEDSALERIFNAFEQADSSRSKHHKGTGLGLHITRRLVELHHGRIWAESQGPGTGSRFVVQIPTDPAGSQ